MTNMYLPGDRVLYQGPLRDHWGQLAIVRGVKRDGELKLQFKHELKLVHVLPDEVVMAGQSS